MKIARIIRKITDRIRNGIRNILPRSKGRYMNIQEAREMRKYKDYFGKRKY